MTVSEANFKNQLLFADVDLTQHMHDCEQCKRLYQPQQLPDILKKINKLALQETLLAKAAAKPVTMTWLQEEYDKLKREVLDECKVKPATTLNTWRDIILHPGLGYSPSVLQASVWDICKLLPIQTNA